MRQAMVDGLTIGVAQLNPHLGDVEGNARKLLACYGKAQKLGVDVVLATELFLTGYPPEDLVLRPAFCERVEVAARRLVAEAKEGMPALIFGLAFRREGGLYNGVVVAQNGRAVWRAKHHLPNYAVFDEKRVFVSAPLPDVVEVCGYKVGVPICADIWEADVCAHLERQGARLLLVPNGSPFEVGKEGMRAQVAAARVGETGLPLVYANQVGGQDELVFDGGSFALTGEGEFVMQCPKWEEGLFVVSYSLKAGDKVGGKARVRADVKADVKAGVKAGDKAGVGNVRLGKNDKDKDNVWLGTGGDVWSQKDDKDDSKGDGKNDDKDDSKSDGKNDGKGDGKDDGARLEDMYRAIVLGLRDYVRKNGFSDVILGLSGGIDSALCAVLAVDALGKEHVRAYGLPSSYTAMSSIEDAQECASRLGIMFELLSIEEGFSVLRETLRGQFAGHKADVTDVTEENMQSRLRGLILMALSNKFGAMLVSTGNKSELSLGYATLYGDMNGGFAPLKDVYKTDIYRLAKFRNGVLPKGVLGVDSKSKICPLMPQNIIDKPPSAELRPNQTDQDFLPPYEVIDGVLEGLVEGEQSFADLLKAGFRAQDIRQIQNLLMANEYKRRQAPLGVKISSKYFGRDRRYPITNAFRDVSVP